MKEMDLPGDGFVHHLCAPLEDGGDDAWLEVGAYAGLEVGRSVRSWGGECMRGERTW